MKIYSSFGFNDFIICLGYKGNIIKEYFSNYLLHNSDVTYNMKSSSMKVHKTYSDPWNVTLVDTGEKNMTGGRLRRIKEYIGNETFCMTYGDGIGDININELIRHHRKQGLLATLTAVRPPGRFGVFNMAQNDCKITNFKEKPVSPCEDTTWINGGYFVLEPKVIDYIDNDATVFEKDPIERLASEGQLCGFRHTGFWRPMDTMNDKILLEDLWANGNAPWKIWS